MLGVLVLCLLFSVVKVKYRMVCCFCIVSSWTCTAALVAQPNAAPVPSPPSPDAGFFHRSFAIRSVPLSSPARPVSGYRARCRTRSHLISSFVGAALSLMTTTLAHARLWPKELSTHSVALQCILGTVLALFGSRLRHPTVNTGQAAMLEDENVSGRSWAFDVSRLDATYRQLESISVYCVVYRHGIFEVDTLAPGLTAACEAGTRRIGALFVAEEENIGGEEILTQLPAQNGRFGEWKAAGDQDSESEKERLSRRRGREIQGRLERSFAPR